MLPFGVYAEPQPVAPSSVASAHLRTAPFLCNSKVIHSKGLSAPVSPLESALTNSRAIFRISLKIKGSQVLYNQHLRTFSSQVLWNQHLHKNMGRGVGECLPSYLLLAAPKPWAWATSALCEFRPRRKGGPPVTCLPRRSLGDGGPARSSPAAAGGGRRTMGHPEHGKAGHTPSLLAPRSRFTVRGTRAVGRESRPETRRKLRRARTADFCYRYVEMLTEKGPLVRESRSRLHRPERRASLA